MASTPIPSKVPWNRRETIYFDRFTQVLAQIFNVIRNNISIIRVLLGLYLHMVPPIFFLFQLILNLISFSLSIHSCAVYVGSFTCVLSVWVCRFMCLNVNVRFNFLSVFTPMLKSQLRVEFNKFAKIIHTLD